MQAGSTARASATTGRHAAHHGAAWGCALALLLGCGSASAISLGTINTFSGSTNGWHDGGGSSTPTVTLATGGPAGASDSYLRVESFGGTGPGSKLVAISGSDWLGNYIGAGVNWIELDAINSGTTPLQLRLYFNSAAGTAVTTTMFELAPGSSWVHLAFPLQPAALTGANPTATLQNVTDMRLMSNPDAAFPPPGMAGILGVDNLRAVAAVVPEPQTWALWLAGVGGVAASTWRRRARRTAGGLLLLGSGLGAAQAQVNQTADLTPLSSAADLGFRIELKAVSLGNAVLPTLQSYASAQIDGKWVLIGGATNGLHGFGQSGGGNFPASRQNTDVWVVDPASGQSWHRSLTEAGSGLSTAAVASLSIPNSEHLQKGDTLYMVGGYGTKANGTTGTLDTLTAINLPGIVNWAMGGGGSAAPYVRQTSDPALTVTGGALLELNGRMQLVFGQNYSGGYTPGKTGIYTQQVRSFDIVDSGSSVSITNLSATPANAAYNRRDLNVFPVLRPDGNGGQVQGATALSGVFTPNDGAWTVPVELDANGQPSMANPAAPGTFKQGFNGYESAKLGLYSARSGTMHEVLFGGISLQFKDEATAVVGSDQNLPFVNDITAVSVDAQGRYSQSHLGWFPTVLDAAGNRMRFGANAEFFVDADVDTFSNGVIALDSLSAPTRLGYVFGGLFSNAPNTRGVVGAVSGASNLVFEVTLVPVPEPSTTLLLALGATALTLRLRGRGTAARTST